MFEIITSFFIATVISFSGSLQLGPVNMHVIQTAINSNFRTSLLVAIGGCIPEIIYCTIAFGGSELIIHNKQWFNYFQIAAIFIFLIIGATALFKKYQSKVIERSGPAPFLSGFILGILNPMLITFWISVITFLHQFNIAVTKTVYTQVAFVLGTAAGAFLLLLTFAIIVTKNKPSFIQNNQERINKILGLIFIILAVIQFLKLILAK